eukprot:4245605-Amphidinium_carterae.1
MYSACPQTILTVQSKEELEAGQNGSNKVPQTQRHAAVEKGEERADKTFLAITRGTSVTAIYFEAHSKRTKRHSQYK